MRSLFRLYLREEYGIRGDSYLDTGHWRWRLGSRGRCRGRRRWNRLIPNGLFREGEIGKIIAWLLSGGISMKGRINKLLPLRWVLVERLQSFRFLLLRL
jgi:hypothetical protein